MSTPRPPRSGPPPLPDADGPLDHALTLLLADDTEAALRWGAAALERTPSAASAVLITARLLQRMGRMRAAVDGLRLAARQAIEEQNLPLAVVAIEDLRHLGADVGSEVDEVAAAFCRESPRLDGGFAPAPFGSLGDFQPLSPFLSGPALASKASQILNVSKHAHEDLPGTAPFAPVPLFSALSKEALRDLLAAFHMITVPAGHRVIEEGQKVDAAYVVARGELEISRRGGAKPEGEGLATSLGRLSKAPPPPNKASVVLSRIGRGAFFGEMAAVSRLAAPSTVTATRPSILLVAQREALEAVAAQRPEVAAELARHCRHHMVANLGWTSPVITMMQPVERAALVERLQMRFFHRGERLVQRGDDARGLHLVVSGEVSVIGRDGRESVALGSLGPGETVGEGELVLCRKASTDAIAAQDTATLWLSRDDFFALVEEHQGILHGLYAIAVRRFHDTEQALQAGSELPGDVPAIDQDEDAFSPQSTPSPGRHLPPVDSVRAPWSSAVATPLGPPVAPLAVTPTFLVHENPPQPSPASRRTLAPRGLVPPSHRPSQPLHGSWSASSAPPGTTTAPSRSSAAGASSVSPTTASLPSPRTATRRARANGEAMKAVGFAAVAAAVVGAALVASRNTGTGDGAAAAAVGAEPASPAIADTAPDRAARVEAVPIAPPPPSAAPPQAFPVGEPRTIAAPRAPAPPPVKAPVRQAVTSAMPAAPASTGPRGAARPATPSVDAVPGVASVGWSVPKTGVAERSVDDEFGGRR